MDRVLRNKEARLRRKAEKKGLFIKKRKWRLYYNEYSYETFDGYCVGISEYGLIVWGGDSNGMNMPTLEEAEVIVDQY